MTKVVDVFVAVIVLVALGEDVLVKAGVGVLVKAKGEMGLCPLQAVMKAAMQIQNSPKTNKPCFKRTLSSAAFTPQKLRQLYRL